MTDATAPPAASDTLVCSIPSDGANAPRALAVDTGGLPVVLRDPMPPRSEWEAFGCKVRADTPATPDRVAADVTIHREVHHGSRVTMPDGRVVEFFGFYDPTAGGDDKAFPSPLIRVREGQVVHTNLVAQKNTHTIHHHGIEPTPHNDGVGHASFEVAEGGSYTYQWRPSHSGTYFYHCHKNTTLHFELGMYGPLIVDPPQGPGHVRRGQDVVTYDHEVLWIPDDVDPSWHELHHKVGLECPWDTSRTMLRFDPRYFLLSGIPHPLTRTDRRVTVTCQRGEQVLVRLLNAAYGPIALTLPFDAEVIGRDGHALGSEEDRRYSRPYALPAGSRLELATAQRYDLLLRPDRVGTHTVAMDVLHWVRGRPHGRVETTITVR